MRIYQRIFKKTFIVLSMAGAVQFSYAAWPASDAVNGYEQAVKLKQTPVVVSDTSELSDDHSQIQPVSDNDSIHKLTPLISQLKKVFSYLTISEIKPLSIEGFYQLNTNSGMIDISTTGEVLLKAKHYLLFNTDHLDLHKADNLIKLVEENTHLKVSDHNSQGDYNYFLIDKATGITSKKLGNINQVIVGLYTTIDELLLHKNEINHTPEPYATLSKVQEAVSQQHATHITKQAKEAGVLKALSWAKKRFPENLITFPATSREKKGVLYVFSDYTCPHCRDLHQHINEFLNNGYTISYFLLPRQGSGTVVAKNMQKALCALNPQKAVDSLYATGSLPLDVKERSDCQANIDANIALAKGFNVTGTPYIVGSNGKMTSGFTTSAATVDQLGMR